MPGFFTRLRERRIVQIVMSVAAGGWIVLTVVGDLVDRSVLPNIIYQVLLVWYVGGLLATVIIGWYHGEKGHQAFTKPEILMLVVVVIGVLTGSAATVRHELRHGPSIAEASKAGLDLRHIAVMYFADETPDKQSQALADGLTEGLIQQLSQVNGLTVVSANGSEQYRNSDLSPDSIARALKVGTLVEGSVDRRGDKLQVSVSLVDGTSGAPFQRESLEEPATDISGIQNELATKVSRILRQFLGQEVELQSQRAATTSNTAWLLVQRAERAYKASSRQIQQDDIDAAFASLAAADSMLAEAQQADTSWVEPTLRRGRVAYQRAYWLGKLGQVQPAVKAIQTAMGYADQVLQKSPGNARALTVRGEAQYWRYLLGVDDDMTARQNVLMDAKRDLEAAVKKDPNEAEANYALGSLYYQVDDVGAAVLASRSAYDHDPFLQSAPHILWNLFYGSYDLESFGQAQRWCEEGWNRFPDDYHFAECHLWMMTTPGTEPNVGAAWQWLARTDSLLPEPLRPLYGREARMIVGGVLGRAGLADSARDVLVSARADPQVDATHELVGLEAFMRTLVGDQDTAMSLLQRYVAANPGHEFPRGGQMSWWWRSLQDQPGFQTLETSRSSVAEQH